MRPAQFNAAFATSICVLGALCLCLFETKNPREHADGALGGERVLIGRAEPGERDGTLAEWRGELRAWRPFFSGDALERGRALRVSHEGCVELLTDPDRKAGRIVLGPGAQAELLAEKNFAAGNHDAERRATVLSLTWGALRATASADRPLQIRTVFGTIELSDGEAAVTCGENGAVVSLLRGTAAVLDVQRASHALSAGSAVELCGAGFQPAIQQMQAGSLHHNPTAFSHDEFTHAPAHSDDSASQNYGRLVLRDSLGHDAEPMEVRELRVRAHIEGQVALTEIEETFFNPTYRQAEGTFYFPIPAGASLSRFAMYVNGRLVEGELVGRERARTVYEQIVRKMQDPALMEWQEGNIFKTRIFPIPAHGPKRILISYTQMLPSVDGERRYVYPLAGKTTQTGAIGAFEFEAEICGEPATQMQAGSLHHTIGLAAYPDAKATLEDDRSRVRLTRKNFRPEHDLVLRVPAVRSAALELAADRRPNEDGFFTLSYMPAPVENGTAAEAKGRDVVVMVDTSLSRRADDYKAQLKVVRTLLRELGPKDRFATLSFDVAARVHQSEFVSGTDAVEKALTELEAIVPLGATDLEAAFGVLDAFLGSASVRTRADVVCVSDGVATLGQTAPELLAPMIAHIAAKRNARIHTVAMGAQHDRLLLREVARQSGGLFRTIIPGDNVEQEAFRLALALESQLLPAPKFEFSGGGVRDVYPAEPGTLVAGEELILTGRYSHAEKMTARVTQGERETSAAFELPAVDSRHVFIARSWARERLDALLLAPQTAEIVNQVTDLSQEFTLITPYTSFLVLENEEAYKTWGIDRQKRRRDWDSASTLRSVPPPEEIAPVQAPAPSPVPVASQPPKTKRIDMAPHEPKPFSLADMDLTLLGGADSAKGAS